TSSASTRTSHGPHARLCSPRENGRSRGESNRGGGAMMLIAGSTGLVGGTIARMLLERGEDVRILVREGSDWQLLAGAGAQPVIGDLKRPESLARACVGVDVVITTASSGQRGGDDNPVTVDVEGNRHLIDAARRAGARHFVF